MEVQGNSLCSNRVSPHSIPPTGLSVVYEPDTDAPIVDIVMVHGLKGHPYKTWRYNQASGNESKQQTQQDSSKRDASRGHGLRTSIKAFIKGPSNKGHQESDLTEASNVTDSSVMSSESSVFWPADLLPTICDKARILTFGYDTKITKYTSGPTNTNSILSHGKDFFFSLGREHVRGRPLIFVAHSLGGILVKELLALSSTAETEAHKGIIESTAAVIFLGTPHRGSPKFSAIAEWARSLLSTLRFQTTSAILDTLGLKTTDLERAHESFCRLWHQYDFQVKTFQEGFGLTGIDLGVLGNKVVPHESSLIGDPREHAETLQANHREMCRFRNAQDPNYKKVAGEIRGFYAAIESTKIPTPRKGTIAKRAEITESFDGQADSSDLSDLEVWESFFKVLPFDGMNSRRETISTPSPGTGGWLFQDQTYMTWYTSPEPGNRFLMIKGKPGAGKSTLMKQAVQHVQEGICASFFIDGGGLPLQRSSNGMYRSLLSQLLPHLKTRQSPYESLAMTELRECMRQAATTPSDLFSKDKLETLLLLALALLSAANKPVYIFLDALDELEERTQRQQTEFWRELVDCPEFGSVGICISSRYYPNIEIVGCQELFLDACNSSDISNYVKRRLKARISDREAHWRELLEERIVSLSAGVFLWVVLTLDDILPQYDRGISLKVLLRLVETMPTELNELYRRILCPLPLDTALLSRKVFQWVFAQTRPLRLDEWHHILAFLKPSPPKSIRQWRESDAFTETDEQLEREIKTVSVGLLEVSGKQQGILPCQTSEASSVDVGAGSLDYHQGSARVVRVIHRSVYTFFIHDNGFALFPVQYSNPLADCHNTIANTCLNYILVPELEAFATARQQHVNIASTATSSVCSIASSNSQHANAFYKGNRSREAFERLRTISTPDPLQIVEGWLDWNFPCSTMEGTQLSEGNASSSTDSETEVTEDRSFPVPLSNASKVLEEYPALLIYSLTELQYHIQEAMSDGSSTDCYALLQRLKSPVIIDRLIALHEGKRARRRIVAFLALASKADYPIVSWEYDQHRVEGPRRPRRIASFSSASSYSSHSGNSNS